MDDCHFLKKKEKKRRKCRIPKRQTIINNAEYKQFITRYKHFAASLGFLIIYIFTRRISDSFKNISISFSWLYKEVEAFKQPNIFSSLSRSCRNLLYTWKAQKFPEYQTLMPLVPAN
jgi:hypothetical protein